MNFINNTCFVVSRLFRYSSSLNSRYIFSIHYFFWNTFVVIPHVFHKQWIDTTKPKVLFLNHSVTKFHSWWWQEMVLGENLCEISHVTSDPHFSSKAAWLLYGNDFLWFNKHVATWFLSSLHPMCSNNTMSEWKCDDPDVSPSDRLWCYHRMTFHKVEGIEWTLLVQFQYSMFVFSTMFSGRINNKVMGLFSL